MAEPGSDPSKILNVNVGVLGHVDSGKTSLVKALSQLLSTASMDKSKQSRERGITLDLGFSAFMTDLPEQMKEAKGEYDSLQVTLVDCPGHASLIRTVIGGAQIIDMMILVVDCIKGIQTQTAECLVIGEISSDNMIIVLNKIDLLPGDASEKEAALKKVEKRIRGQLKGSKFVNVPMIGVASKVGGERFAADSTVTAKDETIGLDTLLGMIRTTLTLPDRR